MFGTFVCVYVCVCSCIVYFCYLRFTDKKKKTIYFWIKLFAYIVALQALHVTHSTLVELSLSLACFLFRFVVISGFAFSLDLCFFYPLPSSTFSTRISTIFTHNSRIFCCDATRTPQRFPTQYCITFFFSSLSLSLSLRTLAARFAFAFVAFFLYFFNTRFAHVDVSFAVVVARCI